MHVLEKVAKALSRNYKITVKFKGTQAYTDKKTIVLPMLPHDISEDDVAKVRGYCDHEIGHILNSDFEILKTAVRYPREVQNLFQLLEDFRIERDTGVQYLGAKVNMEKTAQLLVNGDRSDHIMSKLWVEGRRRVNHYKLDTPDYEEDVKSAFGDDIFNRMSAMGTGPEGTHDALALAKQMLDDFRQNKQDSEKNEDTGDNENCSHSNQDETSDSKDTSEGGDDFFDTSLKDKKGEDEQDPQGDNGKGNDDSSGHDGDDNKGKGNSDDSNDNDGDSDDNDLGNDSNDAEEGTESNTLKEVEFADNLDDWEDSLNSLKKDIERMAGKAIADGEALPFSKDYDKIKTVKSNGNLGRFNRLKSDLGKLSTAKSKIARLFLARQASKWIFDREEGKIDTRKLSSARAGNRSVFKELHVQNDMDTAITLLCDFSGSMGADGVKDVMRAVILMLETLKTAKIQTEVLGYTTGRSVPGVGKLDYYQILQWTRTEELLTYVLKAFSEPYNRKVKQRIGNAYLERRSKNSDADSLLVAYSRIAKQPQRRKIIFVLSDGFPNTRGCNFKKNAQLIKLVKDLEKRRIEVIGIGMGVDVSKFYPKNIELNGTKDIVETMYLELKRILKIGKVKNLEHTDNKEKK